MSEPGVSVFSIISVAAILENIINYTNLVETAEFLLGKYREFYVYRSEVIDEIGKRRPDIEIDIELIAKNKEMLKFVFDNSDVLMQPYVVKLHQKGDCNKIRKTITVQKTPEENKKRVEALRTKRRFLLCC